MTSGTPSRTAFGAPNRSGRWALATLVMALPCLVTLGACGGGGGSEASGTGGSGGGTCLVGCGSGGTAGASVGTVQVVLEIAEGASFCGMTECWGPGSAIQLRDEHGALLSGSAGDCYTECSTCEQLPCIGAACTPPQGYLITGETLTWDGTIWQSNTCGEGTQCRAKSYAAPGTYVAVMCATPGVLEDTGEGYDACVASGPVECVEVPFEYPSSQVYTGVLGAVGDDSPCDYVNELDQSCSGDDECTVGMHQTDCCGNMTALGVNESEEPTLAAREGACRATYPACGCPSGPVSTDSGETANLPDDIQVGCITEGPARVCRTYVETRPPDTP